MNYRTFGKTGLQVSALGFGAMRLPTLDGVPLSPNVDQEQAIAMIRSAIDHGINYIDTAYPYHGRNSETVVGMALADGYRKRTYLATKCPVVLLEQEEDFDRILQEQLTKLQTGYVDFYLLHALDREKWKKVERFHLLGKLLHAREAGKIRYLGFSFHDDLAFFQEVVDAFDAWDFCQIQLNYINTDYQAGIAGLEYAAKRGLAVIAMEPLLGGSLAAPSNGLKAVLPPDRSPVEWALDFLWNRPEISLLLSGMGSMEQLQENLTYASRSQAHMLQQTDLEMLARAKEVYDTSVLVPCTKCCYCIPCPFGLDIPSLYMAYNATSQSTMERARFLYRTATKSNAPAKDCRQCHHCEKVCPQHIPTAALMPKIAEVFDTEG